MADPKPKYPPGATLRCPCGKEGLQAAVFGHRARSKNPLCQNKDPLTIVSEGVPSDPIPDHTPTPDPPQGIAPPVLDPPPMVDQHSASSFAHEGLDAIDANGGYDGYGGYAPNGNGNGNGHHPDAETVSSFQSPPYSHFQPNQMPPSPEPRPQDPTLRRRREPATMEAGLEWRVNSPAEMAASGVVGFIRGSVDLPLSFWNYYEVVVTQPEFGFEGTPSELIALVFESYFWALGYDPPGIRRRAPVRRQRQPMEYR